MYVSVSTLKKHLSQYLHKTKKVKKLIITSHQIPIAIIQAIPKSNKQKLKTLKFLENVSWNGKKPKGLHNPPRLKGLSASKMILEDRE